jgi:YegS/Rv2252/BmrU family lipid kinase
VAKAPETPIAAPTGDAVLIVNAKARNGEEWFQRAKEGLQARGVTVVAAHDVQEPAQLQDLVRNALKQGARRLIVGGGDGTFRSIAGLLIRKEVTLGVLPLGTVNDLARNLGIAPDVETACDVIAAGHVEQIDVGQANDDFFLITASLGFSAQSQLALKPELKKRFGPFGYLVASAMALRGLRPTRIELSAKGRSETLSVLQAGVVNGHSWMGGAFEIPGLDLEKGSLAFYALPAQPLLSCLRIAGCLKRGEFFHTPGLRAFMTDGVTIKTRKPHPLVLDGDLVGHTPARLSILPSALRVFAPASSPTLG